MPHISQLSESKYLKQQDCAPPILVTIASCEEQNVGEKEDGTPDKKWVLFFAEREKGMVLNPTNGQIIAGFLGKDNTDDWTGAKIVLYRDPNIAFGGKLVGGIRCRAPRNIPPAPAPAPAPAPTQAQDEEDSVEIPF